MLFLDLRLPLDFKDQLKPQDILSKYCNHLREKISFKPNQTKHQTKINLIKKLQVVLITK